MERNKTKTERVTIRMTEWEHEQLMKSLKVTKQSASNFIVMAILEKSQRIKGVK